MKKINLKWNQQTVKLLMLTLFVLLAALFVGAVLPACQNTQEDTNMPRNRGKITQKSGLSYSGCKGAELKSAYAKEAEACITLQTVDSDYLSIQHFDAVFNCIFDSLAIDYDIHGNVINIKEIHINPGAYCTCKYDIEYKIGPLEYGTYNINILDEALSQEEICFDFEFTADTDTTCYK